MTSAAGGGGVGGRGRAVGESKLSLNTLRILAACVTGGGFYGEGRNLARPVKRITGACYAATQTGALVG